MVMLTCCLVYYWNIVTTTRICRMLLSFAIYTYYVLFSTAWQLLHFQQAGLPNQAHLSPWQKVSCPPNLPSTNKPANHTHENLRPQAEQALCTFWSACRRRDYMPMVPMLWASFVHLLIIFFIRICFTCMKSSTFGTRLVFLNLFNFGMLHTHTRASFRQT